MDHEQTESADDIGGVEGCTNTDGSVCIVAIECGVTTKVHVVSIIVLLKSHCVRDTVFVPDRGEIVLIRFLGVVVEDDGDTVALCKDKSTQHNNSKENRLHLMREKKKEKTKLENVIEKRKEKKP